MRTLLLPLLLVLASCATTDKDSKPTKKAEPAPAPVVVKVEPPPEPPKIDPDCDRVAQYARTVAQLRDVGISQVELRLFATTPMIETFPVHLVQGEVYARPELGARESAKWFYELCVKVGYNSLLPKLKSEEIYREASRELQRRRAEAEEKERQEAFALKPDKPASAP